MFFCDPRARQLTLVHRRRQEADEIYTIGVARNAVPLDRLKKRHTAFKERMLVAPPLPPAPAVETTTASTSRDARPILAGAGVGPSKPGVGLVKENGARGFAVFQDGADGEQHERGKDWEDLGTVKSRKKENVVEAGQWKGETLPMAAAPKPGALRLEVFRDEVSLSLYRGGPEADKTLHRHRMYPPRRPRATRLPPARSSRAPYADRARRRCSSRTRSRTTATRT